MLSEIYRPQCCIFDVGRRFFYRGGAVSRSWRRHGLRTSAVKCGKVVERLLVCISGMGGIDE